MKKLSLFVLLVAAFFMTNAQPQIKFDNTTYDFGKIKEEGGKVTGRFEFTNVGDSDLVLVNVRPGCGCTAANYSHDPVAPGQRGYIEATYNPYNRPGAFNKNIRVTTNEPKFRVEGQSAPHMIFIKGEVIKRPPTEFEKAGYTKTNGMVRFFEPSVSRTLLNTEVAKDTFKIRNFWNKPVSIQLDDKHSYVKEVYRSFGSEIQPNQEGFIVLEYNAAIRSSFGQIKDVVTFTTNDSIEPKKAIHYAVNIREDFSSWSAKQLKMAPAVSLSIMEYDFGQVQKNAQSQTTVTVTNTGKSPLLIRKVDSSSGYFKVSTNRNEIPVGETATITITFKASSRASVQKATIEVITNDPLNPVQVVNLKGQIL